MYPVSNREVCEQRTDNAVRFNMVRLNTPHTILSIHTPPAVDTTGWLSCLPDCRRPASRWRVAANMFPCHGRGWRWQHRSHFSSARFDGWFALVAHPRPHEGRPASHWAATARTADLVVQAALCIESAKDKLLTWMRLRCACLCIISQWLPSTE